MEDTREAIAGKRKRLDELRPLRAEALARLEHYYDIELTYTSNAIEGNTLTAVETTLVLEQGVTVAGKPLKDHLEALDHFDAIRYVRTLRSAPDDSATAFAAHLRLVEIHPFNDGNGRTARLLTNLILIRAGFPPLAIRPEDRAEYIVALQESQALLYRRLDAVVTDYLSILE